MPENSVTLMRSDWLMSLGLAVVVLVAGSWRMAPGVCGAFHDDAVYVSTAEALATGQGYRLIDVPGSPIQTKYPILYPALLAVIWYIWPAFPENLVALQGATLLFAAAAIAAAYLYLVRFAYFTRGVAASACLLCAVAPYFLYFGVQTMAEMPFALLSITALWGLEIALIRTNSTRSAQFGLGLLLALPFLCRIIGATIIVAGVWALWRNGRPIRGCLAGAAFASLPWLVWSLAGRGVWDQDPVDGYYTDYAGCWSSTGVQLAGKVFVYNALMTVHGSADRTLEGLSAALGSWVGPKPACATLMLIGAAPWLSMVPGLRQGRMLPCHLAVYLAVMLVWSWPPYRFLVPILPFLAAYLLSQPARLLRRCGPGVGWRVAGVAGVVVLILANVGLLARHALEVRERGFPLAEVSDTPVAWSSQQRLFAWLKANSRSQDVISSGLDSMFALYADRKAIRPIIYNPGRLFYGEEANLPVLVEELTEILKRHRPRYLIDTPLPGFAEEKLLAQAIGELRRRHSGWLRVAYQDADPRLVIFELNGDYEPQDDLRPIEKHRSTDPPSGQSRAPERNTDRRTLVLAVD